MAASADRLAQQSHKRVTRLGSIGFRTGLIAATGPVDFPRRDT